MTMARRARLISAPLIQKVTFFFFFHSQGSFTIKIWMPHLEGIFYTLPLERRLWAWLFKRFFRDRCVKVRVTSRELAGFLSKPECECSCSSIIERSNKKSCGERKNRRQCGSQMAEHYIVHSANLFADVCFFDWYTQIKLFFFTVISSKCSVFSPMNVWRGKKKLQYWPSRIFREPHRPASPLINSIVMFKFLCYIDYSLFS